MSAKVVMDQYDLPLEPPPLARLGAPLLNQSKPPSDAATTTVSFGTPEIDNCNIDVVERAENATRSQLFTPTDMTDRVMQESPEKGDYFYLTSIDIVRVRKDYIWFYFITNEKYNVILDRGSTTARQVIDSMLFQTIGYVLCMLVMMEVIPKDPWAYIISGAYFILANFFGLGLSKSLVKKILTSFLFWLNFVQMTLLMFFLTILVEFDPRAVLFVTLWYAFAIFLMMDAQPPQIRNRKFLIFFSWLSATVFLTFVAGSVFFEFLPNANYDIVYQIGFYQLEIKQFIVDRWTVIFVIALKLGFNLIILPGSYQYISTPVYSQLHRPNPQFIIREL